MRADSFLDEADRIGRDLVKGALVSRGQATWLADRIDWADGEWRESVATMGPELATGTAGVGWFLARLASVTSDAATSEVASAALRHGLGHAKALTAAGKLDWYNGSSGIAWAAIDAGLALRADELVEAGIRAAIDCTGGVGQVSGTDMSLMDGESGILAGFLALRTLLPETAMLEAINDRGQRLAKAALTSLSDEADGLHSGRWVTGLARGLSGVATILLACAAATGQAECRSAAEISFDAERLQFQPGIGWRTSTTHGWIPQASRMANSWCGGAAGIGIARLAGYSLSSDMMLLAEGSAAVELIRHGLDDLDSSLCHGVSGALELMIMAGALLDEPSHIRAARRVASSVVQRARARGRYQGGLWADARNPSLLYGLSGTATMLLRLHDHRSLPTPALPPLGPIDGSPASFPSASATILGRGGHEVSTRASFARHRDV